MSSISGVLSDVLNGWGKRELWLTMGIYDVRSKYRRTKIGTMWISLSMVIIAGVMGTLYSAILQKPFEEYVPYLLIGFIVWNLISALMIEGCQVFTANAAAIKEIPVPCSVYIYRMLWRNLIILGYNFLVYLACIALLRIPVFPEVLWAVPAIMLIFFNGMWAGLLFGVINTRYRDFHLIVTHFLRLIFFITPIIWNAEIVTGLRRVFVHYNPFYYFIEIVRAPMLGKMPEAHVIWVASVLTLIGWAIALPVFAWGRKKIAYWV